MMSILLFPPAILIFLLVGILLLLLLDVFLQKDNIWFSCVLIFLVSIWVILLYPEGHTTFFKNHFVWNPQAALLSFLTTSLSILVFIYAYPDLKSRTLSLNTYYLLSLFSILGALTLITAGSFLTLYLGLELMSLPLYAIIMLENKNTMSIEAAIKYIILNALASLLLLYGMALLYSVNQSVMLYELPRVAGVPSSGLFIREVGTALVLIAFLFKLGVFPFHFWVPDVYQGASIAGALFISTIPKFAILNMGLLFIPSDIGYWKLWFRIIGVLSIMMGSLVPLVQTNIKRLLGYASIAHMGFILISLGIDTKQSNLAVFYLITYVLSSTLGFGVLAALRQQTIKNDTIEDLKGLHKQHALLGSIFVLVLITMSGIPPFLGFFGKLALWQALWATRLYLTACITMLLTTIGAYYYFAMIKNMCFESSTLPPSLNVQAKISIHSTILLAHLMALLGLSVYPECLITYCAAAFNQVHSIHYG